MEAEAYRDKIDKIDDLTSQERFEEALAAVEEFLERFPLSPYLLVKRGCLIQLYNEVEHPARTLEVARESLEMACALTPNYVQALIELGYFQYAIEDRSDEALEQFQIAREQAETDLEEALVGEAKSHLDLGQLQQAKEVVDRTLTIFPDSQKGAGIRAEIVACLEGEA
jgi:tetratricopeptide (TPR) repeat protein